MPGSASFITKGDFGQLLFHHFKGKGFNIWFSNYRVKQNIKLVGFSDDHLLEFHVPYFNQFLVKMNGWKETSLLHQYQLTFLKDVEAEVSFTGGQSYDTFDIHFYKELLQPYADVCPRLARFLNDVENKKAARLIDVVLFLTDEMEECIRDILNYSRHEYLSGQFYEGKVHELLILLVDHINLLDRHPYVDLAEQQKAEKVKEIITSDFTVRLIVPQLAAQVCTTEAKLQIAFKQRFGMTVGKFSLTSRMNLAHVLLLKGDMLVWDVGIAVGYPDFGNFCTAFKGFFNYPPGHIHKKIKRQ